MKTPITAAAFLLVAAPVFAQYSGVSTPDAKAITADDAAPALKQRVKPAAGTPIAPAIAAPAPAAVAPTAIPAQPAPTAETVYGAYVPYTGPKVAGPATAAIANDPDAMVVTSVPEREGELREGTLLKTAVMQTLSTKTTAEGTLFTAQLMESVEQMGRVVLPVGSILEGRVTEVHGGRRITGAAALHLETTEITLPDGTRYLVHAQVVNAGDGEFKVTNEGTLKRKDHTKETLAVVGGVTGAGAVTGAVVGGGVGALVGAGIGAGVSTVLWLKQDRQAELAKDIPLTFCLTVPMVLTPLHPVPTMASHEVGGIGGAQ